MFTKLVIQKKLKENSKLIPASKYGKTKLNAEKLLISKFKNKKKLYNLSIGRIFSFTSFNQKLFDTKSSGKNFEFAKSRV